MRRINKKDIDQKMEDVLLGRRIVSDARIRLLQQKMNEEKKLKKLS